MHGKRISVLALCYCLLLVCAGQIYGQSENVLPRVIRGNVVDLQGEPVTDAEVRVELSSWSKLSDSNVRTRLVDRKLKVDKSGNFKVDCSVDFPEDSDVYLHVSVWSKRHFRRLFFFSDEELRVEGFDAGKLPVARGVILKGQLKSPDGTSVEQPTVSLWANDVLSGTAGQSYFYRDLNCDDEGNFKCLVPNKCKMNLTVGAANFAMSGIDRKIELAAKSDMVPELDLGAIELDRGVSVVGRATLRDGSPAAGAVVLVAEEESKTSAKHVSAVKVDQEGNFKLPPHRGKCLILVTNAGSSRRVVDGERVYLNSDLPGRFFEQTNLDLDGKGPELALELKEIEAIEVSGTVLDQNGKPAEGVAATYSWFCQFGPVDQRRVLTDKNGRYKFLIGKGYRPEIRLLNVGHCDAWLTSDTVADYSDLLSNESFGRLSDPEFERFERDVPLLNWQLVGPESRPSSTIKRVGEVIGSWILGD